MADNIEQFFNNTSPSTLPLNPSSIEDVDSIEKFFQPESFKNNTQVSDDSNRNSFMNLLLYGKDNVERNIYRSLDLFSDDLIEADSNLRKK